MTGFEAIYRLRNQPQTARIPIVGTTAFPIPERWMLAGGCDAYISKPVKSLNDFLRTIDKFVESDLLEHRDIQPNEEIVDIEEVLRELVPNVDSITIPHEITVSWRSSHRIPPKLYCDGHGLRKILWNAISYSTFEISQGGQIQIKTDMSEGFALIIEHNRWRNEAGVGLAAVKRLVERCGGSLSKTSVPDIGTTMRISFPSERVCEGAVH